MIVESEPEAALFGAQVNMRKLNAKIMLLPENASDPRRSPSFHHVSNNANVKASLRSLLPLRCTRNTPGNTSSEST